MKTTKKWSKMILAGVSAMVLAFGLAVVGCDDGNDGGSPDPELNGTVTIIGTANVGGTLTVNTDSLQGIGTLSYVWKRSDAADESSGAVIVGAVSASYTLVEADLGKYIYVNVSRAGYSNYKSASPQRPVLASGEYAVRDIGPAGGIIFYAAGTGDWKYLELDTTVLAYQNALWGNIDAMWGASFDPVTGTGTAIGTGKANTSAIVAKYPGENYAANLCDQYSVNNGGVTYDDWFLPSKDELNLVYINLSILGLEGSLDDDYWSSSEDIHPDGASSAATPWHQRFIDGWQDYYNSHIPNSVLAIRAF